MISKPIKKDFENVEFWKKNMENSSKRYWKQQFWRILKTILEDIDNTDSDRYQKWFKKMSKVIQKDIKSDFKRYQKWFYNISKPILWILKLTSKDIETYGITVKMIVIKLSFGSWAIQQVFDDCTVKTKWKKESSSKFPPKKGKNILKIFDPGEFDRVSMWWGSKTEFMPTWINKVRKSCIDSLHLLVYEKYSDLVLCKCVLVGDSHSSSSHKSVRKLAFPYLKYGLVRSQDLCAMK